MTRKPASTSAGTWFRQSRDESGKPCSRTTAGPAPSSATANETPSPATRSIARSLSPLTPSDAGGYIEPPEGGTGEPSLERRATRGTFHKPRRADRSKRGLGSPAAAARDPRPDRAAEPPAPEEPLRHRPRPARQAGRRRASAPPHSAHARRYVQRSRRPVDGQPRQPLRAQRAARVHGARAGGQAARAEPAHDQPRAADAKGVHPRDDAQPARRRVDPVRGARLVQPRQERGREPVGRSRCRRRPVARASDADREDAP